MMKTSKQGTPCHRKRRYSSKWTAQNVVKEARERMKDPTIHVYYCKPCHCYHIGHQ